ncbi:MAG: hypothetical protein ABIG95_05335 [Candidatus Woesearchaeota archaeon]
MADLGKLLQRGLYTGSGLIAHLIQAQEPSPPNLGVGTTVRSFDNANRVLLAVSYWDHRGVGEEELLRLKHRFLKYWGGAASLAVAVFVRPLAEVSRPEYNFSTGGLELFFELCKRTNMPVIVNICGSQWEEVCYDRSELISKLTSNPDNLMLMENDAIVPRRFQSPGDIGLVRLLAGRWPYSVDQNGVQYFSLWSDEVNRVHARNLGQLAEVVARFFEERPDLAVAISTPNERSFPGRWEIGDHTADYGVHAIHAFRDYVRSLFQNDWLEFETEFPDMVGIQAGFHAVEPPRVFDPSSKIWMLWQEFREYSVTQAVQIDVNVLLEAGIPSELVYTHQSCNQAYADPYRRASPLKTAAVDGANIGMVSWGLGNTDFYNNVAALAVDESKQWGLFASNPLSLSRKACYNELRAAVDNGAHVIVVYNYGPERSPFLGYGVLGMPVMSAMQQLMEELNSRHS